MDLVEYRHPVSGFTLPLPADWKQLEDLQDSVPLAVLEPESPVGFHANIVITVEELASGKDLDGWQTDTESLVRQMRNYILLDCEHLEIAGRAAFRRLAHHANDHTGPVTVESWALLDGRLGYTLTASAATLRYDDLADVFAATAAGLRL